MIHGFLLVNKQGKLRLNKYYSNALTEKDKVRLLKDIQNNVVGRSSRLCNFLEWRDYKLIFRRYASLYFISLCDKEDNELITLEIIHHYVEALDGYFGNVCELDLVVIFNIALITMIYYQLLYFIIYNHHFLFYIYFNSLTLKVLIIFLMKLLFAVNSKNRQGELFIGLWNNKKY